MAFSAHKDDETMKERLDEPDVLERKIDYLANLVRKSRHMVAFTGAGISTSAGIPDFRGPQGVWTLRARGERRTAPSVSTLRAFATPTHMALLKLEREGVLKHLISQNCDGLHRKSGFDPAKLSELHGNSNMEECESCCTRFFRDFRCGRLVYGSKDHFTGRQCPLCEGRLLEWTIDFGQSLPDDMIESGFRHARYADLHLALGSSLTVSPACDMPAIAGESSVCDLVVVNLQRTPLDDLCSLRIYAKTDVVMEGLMRRLDLDIPRWQIRRKILFTHSPTTGGATGSRTAENRMRLVIQGVDPFQNGLPASLFKSVKVADKERNVEPYCFSLPSVGEKVKVELRWQGHYGEPDFDFTYEPSAHSAESYYLNIIFDPYERRWKNDGVVPVPKEDVRLPASVLQPPGLLSYCQFPDGEHPGCWPSAELISMRGNSVIALLGGTRGLHHLIDLQTLQPIPDNAEHIEVGLTSDQTLPGAQRWGHSTARVHAALPRIFVFGGWNKTEQFRDLWLYDPSRRNFLTPIPVSEDRETPSPRAFHGASVVGSKFMYIFGGVERVGDGYEFHNDLWRLNLKKTPVEWERVQCKGSPPPARGQHGQVAMGHYIVIVGGMGETKTLTDMYICDTIKCQWVCMSKKVPGLDSREHNLQQNEEMPVLRPSLSRVGPQLLALVTRKGLFVYDTKRCKWSKHEMGDCPSVSGHAVANQGSTVVLLGGEAAHGMAKIKV